MSMSEIFTLVEASITLLVCAVLSRYYLHMFQLESYQLPGYVRWCKRRRMKSLAYPLALGLGAGVAQLLIRLYTASLGDTLTWIARGAALVLLLFATRLYYRALHEKEERKPFKLTARMKRLCAALLVLYVIILWALSMAGLSYFALIALSVMPFLAGWLIQPMERAINNGYANQARAKLAARKDLIKIGITGSYGKTSTKVILNTILSEKYTVLASQESFNTPMGLTRVIRERLNPEHQVFIAEMGARHVGDIRELVELVHPTIGILTSVGPQHLETMGDVAAVANTKFELMEGLPEDGVGFFAADGGEVDKLFARRIRCEKHRAGIGDDESLYMRAEEILVEPLQTRFRLTDADGNSADCVTTLLGQHSVANITLCAAVARRLGLSMEEIARGIAKVKPVEHRLQVMHGANEMIIINDGYNSNPIGAREALRALERFTDRRRVIVTPGFVELGEGERDFNRAFGRQIAACCDVAILVGEVRTKPILEGLREANMPEENIHVVSQLSEVTGLLSRIGRARDVVLFENDLADNHMQ